MSHIKINKTELLVLAVTRTFIKSQIPFKALLYWRYDIAIPLILRKKHLLS